MIKRNYTVQRFNKCTVHDVYKCLFSAKKFQPNFNCAKN